jgi:hypothetical protein
MGGAKTQQSKSFKNIITETIIDDIDEEDINKYINLLKDKIVINQFPLKLKLTFSCEFKTPIAFDIVEFHYSHHIQVIQTENNLTVFYEELIDKFKAWIDGFQERGSGFIFLKIIKTMIKQYIYKLAKTFILKVFCCSTFVISFKLTGYFIFFMLILSTYFSYFVTLCL